MDSGQLRRKDTTKGPPLRILSLDGGGVRGYSMLIILQELMYRAYVETHGVAPKREEIPKPADYFDLIGGTGTGGLIAIMLGRLRLDLETCMETYVRMTKKVFETDKTIAGIPYKDTLFKASKLEEAIKLCVKEHTLFDDEGNDGTATGGQEFTDMSSPVSGPHRSVSVRSNSTLGLSSPTSAARNSMFSPALGATRGNPNASLLDGRENRTKTAVTAVYKGTPKSGSSVLLRSYESRKEAPPEFNCSIWQAGRATCATGLAFKAIKIGQSTFLDEGAGKYNPSPQLLEEAAVNEWPGREVGIFVSIGTGKRPETSNSSTHEWWESFVGGSVGNFAEARRRLVAKIEGCEDTHIHMLNSELAKRGVPLENYCRLNVEVGVGEFGMNEWDRLSDMHTNTRRYMGLPEVQEILQSIGVKIAKIELAKRRFQQGHVRQYSRTDDGNGQHRPPLPLTSQMPVYPPVVELPGSNVAVQSHQQPDWQPPHRPYSFQHSASSQDKFGLGPGEAMPQRASTELPYRTSGDRFRQDISPPRSSGDFSYTRPEPPPIPPKTPINEADSSPRMSRTNGNPRPPYPDTDGPPPIVNRSRKPEYIPR